MDKQLELYLDYLSNQKRYSNHTIISYEHELKIYYEYVESKKFNHFNEVKYNDIRRYLVEINKKNLHVSSIRHHLSVLRSFYKYLISIEAADHNPFDLVAQPKMEKRLPEFLYLDEFDLLIDSIDTTNALGLRNVMILELMYATGIRCEEASKIELTDIDFDRNMIMITGKGSKTRMVPFNDICKSYVKEYIDTARLELMGLKKHSFLFVNKYGDPITTRGIADMIERVQKRSPLNKHVHPHMLRHTFATHMLEGGASIRIVQEILGHESLASTQVYTHVTMENLKNKIDSSHPGANKKINADMFKKD